ncbi:sugar phosphate isomerase/epimerase family protein [Paenibacillus sp. CN-4]|uniref:sugar phosphate isomerase/epimerase family protein n=1 Tax=Paenibacillus nanchangensis TaxID=3348343 RepID=UPI003979E811
MGYGTLAHTVGRLPLRQLAERLRGLELDFVQLALSKAVADIDFGTGKLSPGLAAYVGEHFNRAGVRIGVLGCYIDPVHPDRDTRRGGIDRFKEHLRFARDFGTSIVATETGALTAYMEQDPIRYKETGWNVLLESVREMVEEAEKRGVTVGIEPVSVHTLHSAELTARLLEEVPSGNLGIVFDPVNLLTVDEIGNQTAFFDEAFRLFGDRIVLAHLKDVQVSGGAKQELRTGSEGGQFKTAEFLSRLHEAKPLIDISLECLTEETVLPSIRYVKSLEKTE